MLQGRTPGAVEALGALGDPVVLLSHDGNANGEAALLTHPGWRLVYFDALASVFLPRTAGLEARFPTLDLAARHFRQPLARSRPLVHGAARKEGQALYQLGDAAPRLDPANATRRLGLLLAALGRADLALAPAEQPDGMPTSASPSQGASARERDAEGAATWTLLAACHWGLVPEGDPGSTPLKGWRPERDLAWAQTTYCFRRAEELVPDDPRPLGGLYRSFAVRRMLDAQRSVGRRLLALGRLPAGQAAALRSLEDLPEPASSDDLPGVLAGLLDAGRPEEAIGIVQRRAFTRDTGGWGWALADRLAGACMHLGRPALARRLWLRATTPPPEAVRQCRLADAFQVEGDFDSAVRHYERARRLDPRSGEACWGLAWLHARRGQARPAKQAVAAGLALPIEGRLRADLKALEKLLQGVPAMSGAGQGK
jgi:tetratricopeptide (TPR) repeat protein